MPRTPKKRKDPTTRSVIPKFEFARPLARSTDQKERVRPTRDDAGRWLPGVSGNAGGRPAIGASFAEWLNVFDEVDAEGRAKYSDEDLKAIAEDQTNPPSKRRAAEVILRSGERGFAKTGIPLAANDLDRICDRTVGKPAQQIDLRSVVYSTKRVIIEDRRGALPVVEQPALVEEPAELLEYEEGPQGAD